MGFVLLPTVGGRAKAGRMRQGSAPAGFPSGRQMVEERVKVDEEIGKGDLKLAQLDAEAYMKTFPRSPSGPMLLADVYFAENRRQESWALYRGVILPNLRNFGDADRLFRFGDSAQAIGRPDDAATAYRRVIDDERPYVHKALLSPVDNNQAKLADIRAVAKALVAAVFRQHGYIAEVQKAVHQAPDQPVTHFLYAAVLDEFGRYKDAADQLNLVAALLPSEYWTSGQSEGLSAVRVRPARPWH